MKNKYERMLAGFMAVVMTLLMIPTSAFAEAGNDPSVTQVVTTGTTWDSEYFSEAGNSELQVDKTAYPYSIAVVGDTQAFVKIRPNEFHKLYDWILDNRSAENIQFVMGLGDITDDNNEAQWTVVSEQIQRMDGYVPYSLTVGNHDGYFGSETELDLFRGAFPYEEYQYAVDGTYDENMENSWQTFTVGDIDYLVLALDYMPSAEEVRWADEVVKAHPYHNVILTTHAYLKYDYVNHTVVNTSIAYTDGSNQDGEYNPIQGIQELVDDNSNIVLVMCGHAAENNAENPIGYRVRERESGSSVVEMLINPQCEDADFSVYGCTGMVAMMYFSEDGRDVQVRYYSTVRDRYYSAKSQLTISNFPVVSKNTTKKDIVYLECSDIREYRTSEKTAPKHPDNMYEDYIFAGWVTANDGTDESIGTTTSGSAFAKFVNPDVLQVKAQITKGTKEDTGETNLRFVTTVDSEKYSEVGFEFTLNGKEKIYAYPSTDVYEKIEVTEGREGDAVTYTPSEQFSSISKYFETITITGMVKANYDADFHIKPYWITQDGTKVYGVDRYVHVRDGYTDTISAKIDVDSDAEISAGMCYISYDKENLTYLDTDKGSVFSTENMIHDEEKGIIGFIGNTDGTDSLARGVLTNLNFVRNSNSTKSDFDFKTLGEQFSNSDETMLRFAVDDIAVTKDLTSTSSSETVQPFTLRSLLSASENILEFTITDSAPYVQAPDTANVPTIYYTRGTYDTSVYDTYKSKGAYVSDAVLVNNEVGKVDTIRLNPTGGSFYMSSSDYLNGYQPMEGDIITIPEGTEFTSETDNSYQIKIVNEYKIQLVYDINTGLLRWKPYQEVVYEKLELLDAAFNAGESGHYFYSNGDLKENEKYIGKEFESSNITVNGKRGVITRFTIGSGDFTKYSPYISYNNYEPQDGDILIIPQGAKATCTTDTTIGIEFSYGAKYYYDADATNTKWIYVPYYNSETALLEISLPSYGFDVSKNSFYMKSHTSFESIVAYNPETIFIDGETYDGREGKKVTLTTDANYLLATISPEDSIKLGTVLTIPAGTIAQNGTGSAAKYLKITEEVTFIYVGGTDGATWIKAETYPENATYQEVILGNYNYNSGSTVIIRTSNSTCTNTNVSGKSFTTDEILVNGVRGLVTTIFFFGDSANMYIASGSNYTPIDGDVITIPAGARGYAADGTYVKYTNGFTGKYHVDEVGEITFTQETYYYDIGVSECEHSNAQSAYGLKIQAELSETIMNYFNNYDIDAGLVQTDNLQLYESGENKGTVVYQGSVGFKDGSSTLHFYTDSYGTYTPTNGTVLVIPAGTKLTSTWTGVKVGFCITNEHRLCYYNGQWQIDDLAPVVMCEDITVADETNMEVKEGFNFGTWKAKFQAIDAVTGNDTTVSVTGIDAESAVYGETYSAVVTASDLFGNEVSYNITITVKEGMVGDANDDDIISIVDMVRFVNWLKDSSTYTILAPEKRVNFNGDNVVDKNDLTGLGERILNVCIPKSNWL